MQVSEKHVGHVSHRQRENNPQCSVQLCADHYGNENHDRMQSNHITNVSGCHQIILKLLQHRKNHSQNNHLCQSIAGNGHAMKHH